MTTYQQYMPVLIIMSLIFISTEVTTQTVSSSTDPCYNYTVLDEPWRATNYSDIANLKCDQHVTWVGWYRLMYYGQDVRMPESCVDIYMCSTHAPLWLNGIHPQLEDGVVTRQICGHWSGDCCAFISNPIRVKACPGNYYVYEFVSPYGCWLSYCADITTVHEAANVQPLPKNVVVVRMKASSPSDLGQSSTNDVFLKQLKEELLREGLASNFSLRVNNISKWKDVN